MSANCVLENVDRLSNIAKIHIIMMDYVIKCMGCLWRISARSFSHIVKGAHPWNTAPEVCILTAILSRFLPNLGSDKNGCHMKQTPAIQFGHHWLHLDDGSYYSINLLPWYHCWIFHCPSPFHTWWWWCKTQIKVELRQWIYTVTWTRCHTMGRVKKNTPQIYIDY